MRQGLSRLWRNVAELRDDYEIAVGSRDAWPSEGTLVRGSNFYVEMRSLPLWLSVNWPGLKDTMR